MSNAYMSRIVEEITRRKEACWDLARAERNDAMRQYWNGKYFAFEDVLFLLAKNGVEVRDIETKVADAGERSLASGSEKGKAWPLK